MELEHQSGLPFGLHREAPEPVEQRGHSEQLFNKSRLIKRELRPHGAGAVLPAFALAGSNSQLTA